MAFLSLQPFVPSGSDFEGAKKFFQELGFSIRWDAGDYIGLGNEGSQFILQNFDNREFAENFMITVAVSSASEFRKDVLDKKLPEKYGIRVSEISQQPYGKEVNIIDKAGVCWHFVE